MARRIVDEIQFFVTPYHLHDNTPMYDDTYLEERHDALDFCINQYHPLITMGFLETYYFVIKKDMDNLKSLRYTSSLL